MPLRKDEHQAGIVPLAGDEVVGSCLRQRKRVPEEQEQEERCLTTCSLIFPEP